MSTSLAFSPSNHVTPSERVVAAIAHGGTWFAWFLAPLVVWMVEKDRSPFVARQAMQALLWSAFGTLVSVVTCGVAIPVFLCFHLYAAVRILRGDDYAYPLVGELVAKL